MNITPSSPNPHLLTSKGQCGSSGLLLHDGIYSAAPFGWFGGMLRVRPLPSVGQWSEEEYQSSIEEGVGRGQEGAERVMSHWAEQGGTEPVTWLMADLTLHWRGEAAS